MNEIRLSKSQKALIQHNLFQAKKIENKNKHLGFINAPLQNKEEIIILSHVKRFIERQQGDPGFRQQLSINPDKAVDQYKIKVDPEEIRPLWDQKFFKDHVNSEFNKSHWASIKDALIKKYGQKANITESVKIFLDFFADEAESFQDKIKQIANSTIDPRFKAWRERQINRTKSQFKKVVYESILHIPVCFELSKGCSVGCWFCGVSAPRLSDIFLYSEENARLWREVLELVQEMLGLAASTGFCYWATDPLDNPDYEKFCIDFSEIMGIFPSTTTALALRDPERTRSLLKLSTEQGLCANRFSIISLENLRRLHEEFTAEELVFVKLVLQNKEAIGIKAVAGRALYKKPKNSPDNPEPEQTTIACVSGFLFSMVDRSVKLISPCPADDRWPLGYIVYDQGNFCDANDLKNLLERMIAKNMPIQIKNTDKIKFRRDLTYESLPDGFKVSTKFLTRTYRHGRYLKTLGDLIQQGDKTAEEIAGYCESYGIAKADIFDRINELFNKGVLDEEPPSE